MRVLGEEEVRRSIDSQTALTIARDTLVDQASGQSRLSLPSAMSLDATPFDGPRFKFKAATVGYLSASGIRLLARTGNNTDENACNHVAVYDHKEAGRLVGLVSEQWLSRIRTAAFGVAAVEALLPPRPLRIGLFGTGKIAEEIVPLLSLAFSVRELKVFSRSPANRAAFAERHRSTFGPTIAVGHSAEDVVVGADLVFTLTESKQPLVKEGWLGAGAVLCSMGSYNEVEYGVLGEAVRLVVDDPDYDRVAFDVEDSHGIPDSD